MIPADEELPEEIEVELEKALPKNADEAMIRYAAAVEKMADTKSEVEAFPKYHVEVTFWGKGPVRRIEMSCHVPIARAILKELLTFRGILREFEEDEG